MTQSDGKVHVLLVDDEVDFLAATAKALMRREFLVSTAADGDTAIRLLQRENVDVAVLDVKMPGISGDELFRIIKRRWPEIPVVMLTGHGSVTHAFTSSREGVVEYLAKPCDVEKLARIVRRVATSTPASKSDAAAEEVIRVMVIDDEQEMLDVLSLTLSRRGMKVATARSGSAGLELLAQESFDVVLLDLKIQGEHGLDVLEAIKHGHSSVEVIIYTGQPSAESAVSGLQGGAFDYLSKPTDMKLLIPRIRAAYQHRMRRLVGRKVR